MNTENIKSSIEKLIPGITLKQVCDSILIENPADLPKVAKLLKESEFSIDYLSSVTGADYIQYLESVYHFYSMAKKIGPIVLRVRVSRENPKVPSLVSLFRSAEFQEREAYDTFGIIYEGHPDLRRIFMWEGYEGFPLRKDYQQEDSETLEAADVAWLTERAIVVPEAMSRKAEELAKLGKRALAKKPGPEEAV